MEFVSKTAFTVSCYRGFDSRGARIDGSRAASAHGTGVRLCFRRGATVEMPDYPSSVGYATHGAFFALKPWTKAPRLPSIVALRRQTAGPLNIQKRHCFQGAKRGPQAWKNTVFGGVGSILPFFTPQKPKIRRVPETFFAS